MFTRIVCAVAIAALVFSLPLIPGGAGNSGENGGNGGAVYAADVSPTADHMIRVHLSSLGSPSSVSLSVSGSYTIKSNGKAISGSVTVAANGSSGIKVSAGGAAYSLGRDVILRAANQNVSNSLAISGNNYPGDLRVLNKSGKLKLISHVDMETYVLGVVPYESGNSKSYMEAIKAQAVAARTFAYFVMNSRNRASQEHDVVNTTSSQVYNGYKSSYSNANKAVAATACQILQTPSGGNVYTCYSASNGGHTEYPKSSGASATNFDYLPYKKDAYDLKFALSGSSYSAQVTVKKSISASTLKTSNSQPYSMLRAAMKSAGVDPANLSSNSTVSVKKISLTNPRYTDNNTPRVYTGADFTLGVPAYGKNAARDLRVSFKPYVDGSGIKRPFLNDKLGISNKSKFSLLYLRNDSDSYLLASVRYGHSAGMSQVGAYQMALSKKNYRDILAFYYLEGSKTKLVAKNWNINNGIINGPVAVTPAKPDTSDPEPDEDSTGSADSKQPDYKVTAYSAKGNVYNTGSLNVRSGPGTSYDRIGSLKEKASVTITGKSGKWYRIKYNSGSAFVSKDYIKIKSAAKKSKYPFKAKVNIKSGKLSVRSGPASKYAKVGSLKRNAKITIKGAKGTWYKISYKKKTAYVAKKYIKAIKG